MKNKPIILSTGEHCGFEWKVKSNGLGYRCGYILIPENHPWHGKEENDINVSCHGGLTYASQRDDGFWIGFDCAHCGDAADPELPGFNSAWSLGGEIRSQEYVENECKELCKQAGKAKNNNKLE